jgi:hypothetical protein
MSNPVILFDPWLRIGEMVVDDLGLILRGLPAQRLQAARPETVGRWRNPPGRSCAPGTRL